MTLIKSQLHLIQCDGVQLTDSLIYTINDLLK